MKTCHRAFNSAQQSKVSNSAFKNSGVINMFEFHCTFFEASHIAVILSKPCPWIPLIFFLLLDTQDCYCSFPDNFLRCSELMFIIPWCRQPSTMILYPCNHSTHGTSIIFNVQFNLVVSLVWYLVKYCIHFRATCENVLKHIFAQYVTFFCSSRYTYNIISNVLLSLI